MKTNIYQIAYNDKTFESVDRGFLVLDNRDNFRPDWREYWPIRNFLLTHTLEEDSLYGFLSPKFKEKTGLSSIDCLTYIEQQDSDTDVILFSPFFDLGAFFQNSFYQALVQHPNSNYAVEVALELLAPNRAIGDIVMHSGNNIFCNFFIARPPFWRTWLAKCELIWHAAEEETGRFSSELNAEAVRHDSPAAIKTFIIERIASLILATDCSWRARAYDPLRLPFSSAGISRERAALIEMDALKIAYCLHRSELYLQLFRSISDSLLRKYS